ncbi:MAG: 5-(carboxyamino)imidazole ribonucleotide synthase [Chloroflexi bacterium]|nr:5-(carboxyamino)imidazole ribonucleotide synthase [Chloroflexota bacterium]
MIVGILGGGQLGRMLALAGYPLGLRFRLLDPSPESPGGHLAELQVGPYDDPAALERFADGLTAATYEFENVPEIAARTLAARAPVYPPALALETAQDRLAEKRLFEQLGIPLPRYAVVGSLADLEAAVARLGRPSILKTRRLGYDGKGQVVIRDGDDLAAAWASLGGVACVLEERIPLRRELSVLSVRGRTGETAFYPLVENVHREGILRTSVAPALGTAGPLQALAESYAERVLSALEYVGVLGFELFVDDRDGRLLANEIAPRVHNSGHWTIEGAECSQFENHLRAVLGWPLGSTAARGHAAMVNLIGTAPPIESLLRIPGAHVHLYGKSPRPGRKIGHVNVVAATAAERDASLAQVVALADAAA